LRDQLPYSNSPHLYRFIYHFAAKVAKPLRRAMALGANLSQAYQLQKELTKTYYLGYFGSGSFLLLSC
jgi:hypothetical protein